MLWLLTLPLVMARFHIFSPVAIVLNVVLWPLMSLSVLSGFGVLVFGTICPPLGYLCGWLCDLSFRLLEDGVTLAERMPAAISGCPVRPIGGCGDFMADWACWPPFRAFARRAAGAWRCWSAGSAVGFAAAAGGTIASGSIALSSAWATAAPACWNFPRARPCSTTPASSARRRPACGRSPSFLWSRGITRLDAVVLSHPDIDHYNALPGLLEKFSVGAVYVSPVMFEKRQALPSAALREAIDRHGVPVREVRAGDRLAAGDGCTIEVLHPAAARHPGQRQRQQHRAGGRLPGRRILLPGDLESPGLDDLLAEEPSPCEVLMAPHHGSRKSNSPALAKWCAPEWVVFSGDGRWNLPEIDATYQAVGSRTLHTNAAGAVHVGIAGGRLEVSPFVAGGRD